MIFGAVLASLGRAVSGPSLRVLPRRQPPPAARRLAVGLLLASAPLAAFALHLYPGLQAQALAAREAAPAHATRGVAATAPPRPQATPPGTAAGPAKEPTNSVGWIRLAGALGRLHRFDEAAQAYGRAAALTGQPALLAAHGEALILASGGTVTPRARYVLLQVLEKQPDEIRSRYYLGLAEIQAGRSQEGLQIWSDLMTDRSVAGAWRQSFRRHIRAVAALYGVDPVMPGPRDVAGGAPPPGFPRGDIEAIK